MARLVQYSWPGNVRELRNVIERIVILEADDVVRLEHLPGEIRFGGTLTAGSVTAGAPFVLPEEGVDLEAVERSLITQAMSRLPDMRIVAAATVRTYAEYQQKLRQYQGSADMIGTLGIFNLKDEQGRNVPYQEVQKWTVENSRLPDFAFWIDRVHYGTLCAVTVSEREQGRAAGRIARGILTQGKSPSSYPMEATSKGLPVVSLARARTLGLRLDADVLLTAEVIQRFEWDQP